MTPINCIDIPNKKEAQDSFIYDFANDLNDHQYALDEDCCQVVLSHMEIMYSPAGTSRMSKQNQTRIKNTVTKLLALGLLENSLSRDIYEKRIKKAKIKKEKAERAYEKKEAERLLQKQKTQSRWWHKYFKTHS
jgi:hypothetical protein